MIKPLLLSPQSRFIRNSDFVTLNQFSACDMLEIHYKWMVKIFCSIFIEQSTMPAVIGVFSSAISTKRNNTVKCNVTY